VPDVSTKGYTEAEARLYLQGAGFTQAALITKYPRTTTVAAQDNIVIDQSPAAGTAIDPTKDTITLYVGTYAGGPTATGTATPTGSPTGSPTL
jgi:beta-lactam-binding protein with PASTA domain